MSTKVLVTYSSKYGATKEIAERIADQIRKAGLSLEIIPVTGVGDVSHYSAVILGSAVYIGNWRKEAVKFLEANEKSLAERPVWIFPADPQAKAIQWNC